MKISSVQLAKFNSNQTNINNSNQVSNEAKKQEGIDILLDKVKNPSDVNDCVAVPRGIFKAYILLMTSTGLSAVSSFIPKKLKAIKSPMGIVSGILGILSAFYFAKPFAIKSLSPTVKKDDLNNNTK